MQAFRTKLFKSDIIMQFNCNNKGKAYFDSQTVDIFKATPNTNNAYHILTN